MLTYLLFVALVYCQTRLDFNGNACNNYLKKFGNANSVNGVGPTSLSYTGEAAISTGTSNLIINLWYYDSLYSDEKYFGLSQEDGKSAEETCLDLKLWKFTSNSYNDPTQVADLSFTASTNLYKKWRYLSFTINQADFATRMTQTSNSNNYLYIGYYAISYYAAGTNYMQYTFYFKFLTVVSKSNGDLISLSFTPWNQYETIGCTISSVCTVKPSTKLQMCSDETCQDNSIPNLYQKKNVYLQQIITVTGLSNYYLVNTVISYVGDGLYKQITPLNIDNSQAGKVTIQLNIDIVWSSVQIQVLSYIATVQKGARLLGEEIDSFRFLQSEQIIFDPVSGVSNIFTCIKMSSIDALCATCSQQCQVNGFSSDHCDECKMGNKTRLDFNSEACGKYLQKFDSAEPGNQTGRTLLSYTGDISQFYSYNQTKDIIVNLKYYDSLAEDFTYFGLSQEDGKTAEETCLDFKIYKFSSNSYADPMEIKDLIFTSGYWNKWRFISFTINQNQLSTKLTKTINSNFYLYTGYYALAYYSADTTEMKYAFYFQFSVTESILDRNLYDLNFKPFNQQETLGCKISSPCTVKPSTTLKWCTDATCSQNTIPDLHFHDVFYIQQIITTDSLINNYLINTVVWFIGDGLNQQAQVNTIDNSKTGQVIIQLYAGIAWSNLKIDVISYISTTQTGERLLEEQQNGRQLTTDQRIYDPVSGTTETISCIKGNSTDTTCPTCSQECIANHFSRKGCDECSDGRLNSEGQACRKFTEKFNSFLNQDSGPTILSFTGNSTFNSETLIINIRYFDPLFDDDKYFGLTQEDGKPAEETCLNLVLFQYSDSLFINPIEVTDLPFQHFSNQTKKWRYLSFTINSNQFPTRLVKTANSNYYLYTGYYALSYQLFDWYSNIYFFPFQFSVIVSKSDGTIYSTSFLPYNSYESFQGYYYNSYDIQFSSELKLCSDATCSNNTIPNLYLHDQFYLLQIVNQTSFNNYYLINTTVYYVGQGLYKQTIPVKISNFKPGQVLLLLNADIAWSNFSIQVTSYLSTTQKGSRLLEEQNLGRLLTSKTITFDPVSGKTEPIECIKMHPLETTCPTCDDECKVNGFARENCSECVTITSQNMTVPQGTTSPQIFGTIINITLLIYLII